MPSRKRRSRTDSLSNSDFIFLSLFRYFSHFLLCKHQSIRRNAISSKYFRLSVTITPLLLIIFTLVSSESLATQKTKAIIDISMYPEHVVLGKNETAEVRVKVTSPHGLLNCEKIRIHSNTGVLSPLESTGEGTYKSTLTMPDSFFPRFALIASVGTCGGVPTEGHTVIPLYGSGEVEVKAKPFSEVRLKIAEESFGPKRTNERGKVRIPIVVPPGYFYGTVGNKKVDLELPPVNRVVAIADRTEIMAGDEGRTIIWIFAIDQKGAPLVGGEISLSVDKGKTTKAETISAGVYRSFYSGPKLIGDQSGRINVSIDGDPASRDRVRFDFKPGKPAKLQINTHPHFFKAGETESLDVTISVADQYGNPTGNPVTLNTDFGTLEPLEEGENGEFKTKLTIPNDFGRRDSLVFSGTGVTDSGQLSLKQKLPLKAGTPSKIIIEQPEKHIAADGKTPHLLRIQVLDKFGNPVKGEELSLDVSQGSAPRTITTDTTTIVPYTPPLNPNQDRCRLKATIHGVSETTVLSLTNRTYLIALTPRIGYIFNAGNLSTFHSNLSLEQNLWFLMKGLHLGIEVGHHFSKAKTQYNDESIQWSFHDVGFHGFLGYRYWFLPRFYASLNAGLGFHVVVNQMRYRESNTNLRESAVQLSYQFEAEAGYQLGPGSIAFQFGYGVSKPSKIGGLTGNMNGFVFMLGYRMEFF